MQKKILSVLGIMLLMVSMFGIASAYDEDNPYTVTINYIVGDDTSFTAELAGAESTIDFNPTNSSSKYVEPDSQDDGGSTPILTLTKTGNVNLDFTQALNETNDASIVLMVDTDNAYAGATVLTDSFVALDSGVSTSTDVYMWANFTETASGTIQRTYQVNSTTAA